MKHVSISSTKKFRDDRTTGLSATQAAEAAALNVSHIDPQLLASMAADFIKNFDRSRPTLVAKYIKQAVTETWTDNFEAAHYLPSRAILQHDIVHAEYLSHLLAPSQNSEIRELASDLASASITDHARALDWLREGHRPVYKCLIRGDIRTTLRLACKLGSKTDQDRIKQLCLTHGRIFAVCTAHDKIAYVRRHSVSPLGERFAGFKVWLTVGHVVLATVAAPSRVLQKIWTWEAEGGGHLQDGPLLPAMVERNFLTSSTIGRIPFEVAKMTRSIIGSCGGKAHHRVSQAFDYVACATRSAADLGRGDIQRDGLSRTDFTELRLGLTATEAATYVAIELLRAFDRIDACVDAISAGRQLPETIPRKQTANSTIFCAAVLRAEGLPDRHACAPWSFKGRTLYDLDKARNAGRPSLLSLNEKLADPEVTSRAVSALGIDGTFWFTR